MSYQLDTNILLEFLLDQERADDVERFLRVVPQELLFVTEFSVHSIGVLLLRRKLHAGFIRFVEDILITGAITIVRLEVEDLPAVSRTAERKGLSFDDAYQYVAAEKHNLTLVSFDSDFDRTDHGRKTPADILGEPPVAHDKPPTKPARRRSRKR
ncbi:MAG: PIN domain-containing protein [candidate division WOR-3 bacterium]|nr:PIN domain-containing protein [candidate division WOR-3 bacterium]